MHIDSSFQTRQRRTSFANQQAADAAARRVMPAVQNIRAALGAEATLAAIAAALNARGLRARRGGEWTITAVRRILERADATPSAGQPRTQARPATRLVPRPSTNTAHSSADRFASRVGPIAEEQRQAGATLMEVAAQLTASGILTPYGRSTWTTSGVINLLRRYRSLVAAFRH